MKSELRILVIDDDPIVTQSCRRVLGTSYYMQDCSTGNEGLAALASGRFDLAIVDLRLPDIDGMDILRKAPDSFPDVPIIIITGYSAVRTAVEAIKIGAFDYIAKPFTPDELEAAVTKGLRQRRLLTDHRRLKRALKELHEGDSLIGESSNMKKVFSLIEQVAGTDSTVLLTGESGTGKGVVARAIHFSSRRKDASLVVMDCGSVAPTLISSELFGHVSGAFTGATMDRPGLIRSANGGTLFLDEVNNLPLDCQAALLRVIEDREVRPVGESKSEKVDVRFILASNQDLSEQVKQGQFREDLFYRLSVFPIQLPPLRERKDDIPILIKHFVAIACARLRKRIEGFTPDAIEVLEQYDWPGNVRELSNFIERIIILTTHNHIGKARVLECLFAPTSLTSTPKTAEDLRAARKKLRDEAVVEVERAFLVEALRRNEWNVTRAAEETGMQRSNFQVLLKKHELRVKDMISGQE